MRIAVLTTSYPNVPGDPSGHFVEREVRTLVREGHEVSVFAPRHKAGREPGNPRLYWIASGTSFGFPGALARIRERPLRALGAAAFVVRTQQLLSKRGPFDRVIAHWLLPSAWPIASRLSANVPLEAVAHGSDVRLLERLPQALRRSALAPLLRRGASVRSVSHELAARLLALAPELAHALRVEPCALDLSSAPDVSSARAALHDGRTLVVIAARLVPSKRVDVALRAAALAGMRSVVIGDGPLRAELEQRFPGVEFLGQRPRPECLRWLAAADVVLSASTIEGAPTVLREARGLGTKAVSLAAGDTRRWAGEDADLYVVDA